MTVVGLIFAAACFALGWTLGEWKGWSDGWREGEAYGRFWKGRE